MHKSNDANMGPSGKGVLLAGIATITVASILSLALPVNGQETSTTTTTSPATTSTSTTTSSTTTTSTTTTTTIPNPAVILQQKKDEVNGITYIHNVAEPAMRAFAIVAETRGWSQDEIAKWSAFASDVMLHESGYCYNLRRGAIIGKAEGCVMAKQGKYEDSGFAQLIRIHYGPGNWLCEQEGLCSSDAIIADPWSSMTAFVALLERNGKQPWCFTDSLRATSRCRNAPKGPPQVSV